MIQNRRQNAPKIGVSRGSGWFLAAFWLQTASGVAPGTLLEGPGAPPGSLLRRLAGPCWVQDVPQEAFGRERKSTRKLNRFRMAHGGDFFLKIWWFWVAKRVKFECQSGAKLAFELKTCKRLPALRFLNEFHRFLVSRGYVFGPNSRKKR